MCSNISHEEIDRWTDNIERTLHSPKARKKFTEFLITRKLDEARTVLNFWEKCNLFLLETNNMDLKSLQKNPGNITYNKLRKDMNDISKLAEDEINLDFAQLRTLQKVVKTEDIKNFVDLVKQLLKTTADMLKDDFDNFRKLLLKSKR